MVFSEEWYRTNQHPRGMSGKKHSDKTKKNMSMARKDVPKSKEHRDKIAKSVLGDQNHRWLGDAVGYKGLHAWVRRHLPKPNVCQECKHALPYDLANISQKYRRDISDWEWLCRKCHMTKDGRLEQLKLLNNNRSILL